LDESPDGDLQRISTDRQRDAIWGVAGVRRIEWLQRPASHLAFPAGNEFPFEFGSELGKDFSGCAKPGDFSVEGGDQNRAAIDGTERM
jgi:hypothetical protein